MCHKYAFSQVSPEDYRSTHELEGILKVTQSLETLLGVGV